MVEIGQWQTVILNPETLTKQLDYSFAIGLLRAKVLYCENIYYKEIHLLHHTNN